MSASRSMSSSLVSPDDRRDGLQPGRLRRPPAPLAHDELVSDPWPTSRTTTGCSRPTIADRGGQLLERLLVELRRGCRGFGEIDVNGISAKRAPSTCSSDADSGGGLAGRGSGALPGTGPVGMSAPESLPESPSLLLHCTASPSSLTTTASLVGHLGRGFVVGQRAARTRIVGHDRLPVARRLRHPYAARDHRVAARRSPKWLRTSSATWAASRVRASYIVSRIVETSSSGFRCALTRSTVRSSWPSPSSA